MPSTSPCATEGAPLANTAGLAADAARVSVLLPAYNAERFLDAAIASVQAQTVSDWELIAVDDCSRDATYDRLLAWARRDPRIRVFRNEANAGMTRNWNRCLAEVRGDFVLKLDADDALRPRTLETLCAALADPEVSVAGVRTLLCSEDLEPIDGLHADHAMLEGGINPYSDHDLPCEEWVELALQGIQFWHSCAFMSRRETLQGFGGYDARFGCASDTELLLRLLEHGSRFAHRAYVGVLYRQVNGSVSQQFRSNDWLRWEATAVNLLSMRRWQLRKPLSGRLRRRYVEQWKLWRNFASSPAFSQTLPQAVRERLSDVVREAGPPGPRDRLLVGARELIRRFFP